MRSRIDWKYALSFELTDSGFNYSVLGCFRERLIASNKQSLMFDRFLEVLRDRKLLKKRGIQRTDSTHILASIRVMNRLEVVTEPMRAALNQLAVIASEWLKSVALPERRSRYNNRAEQGHFPSGEKAKAAYGETVGRDGARLLKLIDSQPPQLAPLEIIETLPKVWETHYSRNEDGEVLWRSDNQLPKGAALIESPYDPQARHSRKRSLSWTRNKVHLSEICDDALPRLITDVHTTAATTQDVASTALIEESLAKRNLLPSRQLVDAGYVDAELLITSRQNYDIELLGPARSNVSWQARTGGIDAAMFEIDWENRSAVCPKGNRSRYWRQYQTNELYSREVIKVKFESKDCRECDNREKCVRNKTGAGRQLLLPIREHHQALKQARSLLSSKEGNPIQAAHRN